MKTKEQNSDSDFKKTLMVTVVTAILTVIGTLCGVYLGDSLNSKLYHEQFENQRKLQIFNKRIELIDRSAKFFGSCPGIQDVWGKYLVSLSTEEIPLEQSEKLAGYRSDFESIMYQSMIYFGPKTNEALKILGEEDGPWWSKSKVNQEGLIKAMTEELNFWFTENVKKNDNN